MTIEKIINHAEKLIEIKNYDKAIKNLSLVLDENKEIETTDLSYIHYLIARCYFYLSKENKEKPIELINLAIKHHELQLSLSEQLDDKEKELFAEYFIAYCKYKLSKITKDINEKENIIEQAIYHYNNLLVIGRDLNKIEDQVIAELNIGVCYSLSKNKELNTIKSIKHFYNSLYLLKNFKFYDLHIETKLFIEFKLAESYINLSNLETNKKDIYFNRGVKYYKKQINNAELLSSEIDKFENKFNASYILACNYLKRMNLTDAKNHLSLASILLKNQIKEIETEHYKHLIDIKLKEILFIENNLDDYFKKKKELIKNSLFDKKNNNKLEDITSRILTILNIPPIEIAGIPLSHYTSSTVCNKLFGVLGEQEVSPMRIGSSTYMNDPSEGQGILELLNQPELELENKNDCMSYNAFFSCFSRRVNDLNQFRLYGKEDGVEASGCCLVFNKSVDWLQEADISLSFTGINSINSNKFQERISFDANIHVDNQALPLYQVAYIAYKDEYITDEKCNIWLSDEDECTEVTKSTTSLSSKEHSKFGILLEQVGSNEDWQNFRIKELKNALLDLISFFKSKKIINNEEKIALEYIRYLFKDFAFRDEEEFRLLKIVKMDSEEIEYCETTNSIYLPYADIRNMVDEVILGTNYEKTNRKRKIEVFQHLMKKKCPNVSISRSSLPIYANPPIGKN